MYFVYFKWNMYISMIFQFHFYIFQIEIYEHFDYCPNYYTFWMFEIERYVHFHYFSILGHFLYLKFEIYKNS